MVRSKDPLTAATTTYLMPALKPLGFRRVTTRVIGRIQDDIFQFVSPALSAWGGKDFCVQYASLLLLIPRDGLALVPGGRLRRDIALARSREWWPAQTHQAADISMQEIVATLKDQIIPWFEATGTKDGLLMELSRDQPATSIHHLEFEGACCMIALGRLEDAHNKLQQAIQLYRQDGRQWCAHYITLCEELMAGVAEGQHQSILERWKQKSINNLKLHKLV